MAYDRYDDGRGGRREPAGYREDRFSRDHDRYRSRGRDDDRGFFERARDEMSSWFGDESSGGRRDEHGYGHERGAGWFSGGNDDRRERGYGRDRGNYERGRDYGRERDRDDDRAWRPMNWTSSNRDYREDYDRGAEGSSRYQPMAGDYARGAGGEARPSYGRDNDRDDYRRRDEGRSGEWDRDPYRRTSFAGSSASSNHRDHPYDEWRRRQMSDMDRDYDEYRNENRSRFESEFGEWREKRQQKRGLLGNIREHMDVVGRDGEHVGTVDCVTGDRVVLTKSDSDSGTHHSIGCTMIDRVEDDRVILDRNADEAKKRWRDEDRERALFERSDQGREGPHMLDRSFSGTYR